MNQAQCKVETGQMDGKNAKQDQNPEDAKHGHPALSITSHSLGFGGIVATLTVLATLTDVNN